MLLSWKDNLLDFFVSIIRVEVILKGPLSILESAYATYDTFRKLLAFFVVSRAKDTSLAGLNSSKSNSFNSYWCVDPISYS